MSSLHVKCINKTPRNNPHEGITHIGGDGWKYTRAEAVRHINDGTHSFYTFVNGRQAWVRVVNGPSEPYLQTYPDGQPSDNLLALPECAA